MKSKNHSAFDAASTAINLFSTGAVSCLSSVCVMLLPLPHSFCSSKLKSETSVCIVKVDPTAQTAYVLA